MPNLLSTKAKRKAMAALVSRVATQALGFPVALAPSELDPDEFYFQIEGVESERGPVDWITLDVCPRGVNLHTKFRFREFAPSGAGGSGKWNHYIWPESDGTFDSFAAAVEVELSHLLGKIKTRRGAIRADRPSMADYWAFERANWSENLTTSA